MSKNQHPASDSQKEAENEKITVPGDSTEPETDTPENDLPDQSGQEELFDDSAADAPESDLPETDAAETGTETDSDEAASADPEAAGDAAEGDAEEPQEQFTLRKLAGNIQAALARYQLPDMLLPRFLAVYFLISGCWILYFKHKLELEAITGWREFATKASSGGILMTSLVLMLAGFALFSGLNRILPKRSKITDQSLGILSILFFDITVLWRVNNLFLTTAVAFVTLVFINYLINKLPSREPYEKVPWTFSGLICLGTAALVTFFIIRGTVAKHQIFGTACHDFGLFVQMFHSLAKNLQPITTAERDEVMSHFHVHASYIYYLLVPFYKAIPKESTLLAAQAILAMGGAIPMFLIAKRRDYRGISLIFMTFAYIFSLAIVSPCFYDFHENAFLPTLLMWLFYAIDKENTILFWIMTVLVCIVKEDAPLYIMCIGLFLFFEKRKSGFRWQGLCSTFISAGYMLVILKWLTANGDGGKMTNIRFGILMIEQDRGIGEVIKNVIVDPAYFFSLLIHEDTLNFLLTVMMPLLFLPFLTKKIHRFWLMVPFIVMNLVIGAGYGYAANIEFQYVFGPICLLFYMIFLNLDDLGDKPKQDLAILLGSAAILYFVAMPLHYWDNVESYNNNKETFQQLEDTLDSIPEDAVVYATPFFISHIAERDELYLYDLNDVNQDANTINNLDQIDFIVMGTNTEIADFTIPIVLENGWTLYGEVPGRLQIYKSPAYTG